MARNKVEIEIAVQADQAVAGLGAVQRGISATGNSAEQLQGTAAGAGEGLSKVGQGAEVANTGLGKTRQGVQSISEQLGVAKTQIAAFISAQLGLSAVKSVAATADEYKNLQAKIKLATGEGALFTSSFDKVVEIAQRTSSNLEQTGLLFGKLTESGKSAGLSTQAAVTQSLELTETINQAIQLSGGSAASSNAAITQLIQGLQGGVLRGDEFNSVMEQSPRLAKALADGLGVTTGELRKMAEAGQLTSDVVIQALKGQSDTLKNEFATLPPTVGRALENLSSSWTLYIGETDKATGASSTAAGAITLLANNLGTLAGYLVDAGQAAAGFYALRLAQNFTATAAAAAAGTVATVANTAATAANAAAAAADAAAFKTLAADVARQTAALGGNTASTVANTAAKSGAAAATETATASVGRFASILGTLKTFTLIGIITNFKDIGTAIGEAAAKLVGYKDRTDDIARANKTADEIAANTVAMRKRMAQATQDAIDKQFDLSKAAKLAIADFDKLTKGGDSAAEAIAKIGKDFNLSNSQGIRDATAILDKLAADGKLSAKEVQDAWGAALKGQDLAEFEVRFKATMLEIRTEAEKAKKALQDAIKRGVSGPALKVFEDEATKTFAVVTREAERLAQVSGAELQEAIKRSGLDLEVVAGGIGKAARSAINDTDAIIQGLDKLKTQGVDTGQVLTASISKGIQTADSQKAIEALKQQIESLRGKLGDKLTDGLLDQAKQKANELKDAVDKNTPGVNSLREAYALLGVKSAEELGRIAKTSKEAFDVVRNSGKASADTLAEAFTVYAKNAIAANGGVATETLKIEAAMRGLTIAVDANGKATVTSAEKSKKAIEEVARAYIPWAEAAEKAAEREVQAREKVIAAREKENDLIQRAIDLENKRRGVDAEGFSTDKSGNRIVAGGDLNTLTGIAAFLKSAGVADEAKARDIAREFADSRGDVQYFDNPGQIKYGGAGSTISMALLKAAERYTFGIGAGGSNGAQQPSTIPNPSAPTVNVRITLPNGTTQTVPTTQEGSQALIAALQAAKLSAGV